MSRLSQSEVETVRAGARRIWRGEWNRRIILLVALFAVVELVLFAVFDAGTWDTPLLFVYLAAVSVAMVLSHRNWFARVERDLDRGELETISGTVRYPSFVEAALFPDLRYAVFIGGERVRLTPGTDLRPERGRDYAAGVLASTRIVVSLARDASDN